MLESHITRFQRPFHIPNDEDRDHVPEGIVIEHFQIFHKRGH